MRNGFTRLLLQTAWLVTGAGMLGCPVDGAEDGVDPLPSPGGEAACAANRLLCDGDDLSRCNARGTDWEVIASCAPGMCDAAAGLCLPGSCGPSCAPGDACQRDSDCAGSSTCDPSERVCVQDCTGAYEVTSAGDLDKIRYCKSINGRLHINLPPGVDQGELAEATQLLEQVTGWLHVTTESTAYDLRFPKLSHVGALTFTGLARVHMPNLATIGPSAATLERDVTLGIVNYRRDSIEFPALERVEGDVAIQASDSLRMVALPRLTTIDGGLEVYRARRLRTFSAPQLASVGGSIGLFHLQCLPYTSVSKLLSLSRETGASGVGCCYRDDRSTWAFGCDGADAPVCNPTHCN